MPQNDQNKIEKSDKAFEIHQRVIAAGRAVQAFFFETARCLSEIKRKEYFEVLGHDSFNAYLHDAELPFAPTMGHALVKTYDQLVIRLALKEKKLIEIGQAKAVMLARFVEGRELAEGLIGELMSEAETQPVHHFRQSLKARERGVEQKDCDHLDVHFKRCKRCYRIEYDLNV